jgi:UDP-N-acetylmuramate--alanine ligase
MTRLLNARRIHIIGIGGAGMSPLAMILLALGKQVTGSDLHLSAVTADLVSRGATVFEGHRPENVRGAELVVMTSAAREDNPEIQAARQQGIAVVKGSQLLGALMDERIGIAVAGTHGKTTTTGMIALILERAGLDPTFVVGGIVRDLGVSGKLGQGRYLVAEADEYDERFLQLRPYIAVVTNIEADHLDFYKNMQNLQFAFSCFAKAITPGGWLAACGDDRLARQLGETRSLSSLGELRQMAGIRGNSLLYGMGNGLDYRAVELVVNDGGGYDFSVEHQGESLGRFRTVIPGRHNVQNAVAAITVARLVGVPLDVVREALAGFHGAARRFEVKGEVNGVTVVDDYAHHPTEIRATLAGARSRYPGRRIVAVHQPHTYSRLRNLLADFAAAFADADVVLICDIYASRESDDLDMHSLKLVDAMGHGDVRYAGGLTGAVDMLKNLLKPGDVLITLGAGDVNTVGEQILKADAEKHGLP